jgi:hypothetical protein
VSQAPAFTHGMRDTSVSEGQSAHFEAKLVPVGDPQLKVDWFKDGRPLEVGDQYLTNIPKALQNCSLVPLHVGIQQTLHPSRFWLRRVGLEVHQSHRRRRLYVPRLQRPRNRGNVGQTGSSHRQRWT